LCISAEVSFSLSGALIVGGSYCVHQARRIDERFLPLAAIPLVFAAQQFCEGWVWTGIAHADARLTSVAATCFLFFALWFWPVWIPLSMQFVARSRGTRWFLRAMTGVGLVIGGVLMFPTVLAPAWLVISVENHSIHYNIDPSPIFHAVPGVVWQVAYIAVVSTPLFVVSEKKLIHAGVAVILSAAITRVFFDYAFASMWCLFAAALSLYLCVVFYAMARRMRRPRSRPAAPAGSGSQRRRVLHAGPRVTR
jgi:hypothetical protein